MLRRAFLCGVLAGVWMPGVLTAPRFKVGDQVMVFFPQRISRTMPLF